MRRGASRVDSRGVGDDSCAVPKGLLRATAAFCLVAPLMGCAQDQEQNPSERHAPTSAKGAVSGLLSRTRPLMSTVFRIQVDAPPPNTDALVRRAFEEIERLEDALSEWREGTDIARINAAAGKRSVKVGEDTLRVVDAGLDVSKWSRGAFDLSWAALWGYYDFRPDSVKIPSPAEIEPRLALIDYRRIKVSKRHHTVFLRKRGMAIGTGGIAKGYALDQAGAILRGGGVENYMIFGGGQVQVHGERDGRPWRVGIQHPRDPETYFASLESTGASFSTSGDYEHAVFDGTGRRWHHLIDPKTGRPATKSLSATVMTAEGIYADALSTAAFVLGPDKALKMFRRIAYPAHAVIVGADCEVYMTPGTQERLRMHVELVDGRLPDCRP